MTISGSSEKQPTAPSPIKTGALVGLIGGALIGLIESTGALLTVINGVLPASPEITDVATLIAGLLFLTSLYAIGGAVGFAILGGLLALWQRLRRKTTTTSRLTASLITILVFLYTLFLAVDRLGIQELKSAGGSSVFSWGLIILVQAAFVAYAAWLISNSLADGGHQGRRRWLHRLRWSTARNVAVGLLLVLLILPAAFYGLRSLSQSKVSAGRVARAASTATSADRPNIILITIDALRADHLGAYGYAKANTPNIDAFANEGVLFEQAISQAPWTFPSFASMFTSMYPADLNLSVDSRHISTMYTRFVDYGEVTLTEGLQDAGYRTQAVVTNPWLRPEFGFAQGFDGFMQVDDERIYHVRKLEGMSVFKIAQQVPRVYRAIESAYTSVTGNPGQPLVWEVRADRVTEEAVSWLRDNRDAPFFLWVHYIDPHYPFDPPQGYRPAAEDVTAERLAYLSSYNEEDVYTGRARLRPEDKAVMVELYDGEIAYNDVYFGQLLSEIDALGLRDNSVVILSSDHGDEFWEHGGYQHGHSLYDELIRIPFIMRGPGLFAEPRRITDDVQHLDLMPTLLDLAGRSAPASAQGRSLLPLLRGDTPAEEHTAYSFAEALFLNEEQKAIRGGGLKLIHSPSSDRIELYNLLRDPSEQHNLTESDPAQTEKLYVLLQDWMSASEIRSGESQASTASGTDPSNTFQLIEGEN
jgi:arylsulfatase A-like enzyme